MSEIRYWAPSQVLLTYSNLWFSIGMHHFSDFKKMKMLLIYAFETLAE